MYINEKNGVIYRKPTFLAKEQSQTKGSKFFRAYLGSRVAEEFKFICGQEDSV